MTVVFKLGYLYSKVMVLSSLIFVNLTQSSVILAKENSIKELFPSDLSVGESVGHFLY